MKEIFEKHNITRDNSLLLIIDVQDKLFPTINKADEMLKNIKIMIEMAKTLNIPTILTEHYSKGLGATVSEIKDSIIEGTPIFEKFIFSAANNETLDAIKASKRSHIIIVGIETHICVYQTVRDLKKEGFYPVVVSDAVSSRTKENWKNGLKLIEDFAVTINTESTLFTILERAKTEEFKKLSPLIR